MMECQFCNSIREEKNVLYEDALAAVITPDKPIASGHLIVIPKAHYPILEEVPDAAAEHCFLVANKTAMVLFDAIGAEGTNIIIQNGLPAGQTIPHASIHILPRKENDGISFQWKPQKITPQKMDEVAQTLKDECDYISQTPEENKEKKPELQKEEKRVEYDEENYLIKQLKRIP